MKKKKGIVGVYFIEPSVRLGTASPGVINKIESQIETFRNAGFVMRRYDFENDMTIKGKILRRIPFTNQIPKWDYSHKFKDVDFIYFRKPISMNYAFRKYLRWIRRQNSKIKIIMEIPTFPYDQELLASKLDFPLYIYDKIGRKRIKGLVDRIALLDIRYKYVFGVPIINIRNGIDFGSIRLRAHVFSKERIDLCCVSNFTYYHAYDRLIKGLYFYYKNGGEKHVYIHMIGDGEETCNLKELTNKYGLSKKVLFYGMKNKAELASFYDMCDIGVGSLGMNRQGLSYVYPLKTREYLAAGLPIVSESPSDIESIKELKRFVYAVKCDEKAVDIQSIICFYDHLISDFDYDIDLLSKMIRELCEKEFNMDRAIKGVVDFVINE